VGSRAFGKLGSETPLEISGSVYIVLEASRGIDDFEAEDFAFRRCGSYADCHGGWMASHWEEAVWDNRDWVEMFKTVTVFKIEVGKTIFWSLRHARVKVTRIVSSTLYYNNKITIFCRD
jgi:hypothetical protein